ncbi:MAG: hypothetical protein V2A79_02355, partial [Planctomycetota bacterium]
WVVNTWGAGNYVGTYVGVYANGDVAEYSAALTGWVRVVANVGGLVRPGTRVLVGPAGAAGSFVGQANQWADFNALWTFTAPADGEEALVVGEQGFFENITYVYDTGFGWYEKRDFPIPNPTIRFTNKGGNDTSGAGTIERPYLTIGASVTAAVDGDVIVVGPGTYAETIATAKRLTVLEQAKNSVVLSGTVPAGAVLTLGTTCAGGRWDISVVNLSNAGVAAVAVRVNNAGALTGEYRFNGRITSGAGVSRAIDVVGNAATGFQVYFKSELITGSINLALANAADVVNFTDSQFGIGPAAWFNIQGLLGRVILATSLKVDRPNAEVLAHGDGVNPCGVNLDMGASGLNAGLWLGNIGGVGLIIFMGAQVAQITVAANMRDQVIQKFISADELEVCMMNIDVNLGGAPVDHIMLTPAGGRTFAPHTARVANRGAATGGALNYCINGSGVGTVVAPVGVGILAQGIANELVLQDVIVAAGPLVFRELAASGAAGFVDCHVIGRLF